MEVPKLECLSDEETKIKDTELIGLRSWGMKSLLYKLKPDEKDRIDTLKSIELVMELYGQRFLFHHYQEKSDLQFRKKYKLIANYVNTMREKYGLAPWPQKSLEERISIKNELDRFLSENPKIKEFIEQDLDKSAIKTNEMETLEESINETIVQDLDKPAIKTNETEILEGLNYDDKYIVDLINDNELKKMYIDFVKNLSCIKISFLKLILALDGKRVSEREKINLRNTFLVIIDIANQLYFVAKKK